MNLISSKCFNYTTLHFRCFSIMRPNNTNVMYCWLTMIIHLHDEHPKMCSEKMRSLFKIDPAIQFQKLPSSYKNYRNIFSNIFVFYKN